MQDGGIGISFENKKESPLLYILIYTVYLLVWFGREFQNSLIIIFFYVYVRSLSRLFQGRLFVRKASYYVIFIGMGGE